MIDSHRLKPLLALSLVVMMLGMSASIGIPEDSPPNEESELPQNIQEMAMILTARAKDCQYIWFAHAARARKEGISDAFVDALRDKRPLPKLEGAEQIVVNYATELFGTNRVSDSTFKAAIDHFGAQLLTELTTMMGYYSMLALNVNAFDVDVPTGGEPPMVV